MTGLRPGGFKTSGRPAVGKPVAARPERPRSGERVGAVLGRIGEVGVSTGAATGLQLSRLRSRGLGKSPARLVARCVPGAITKRPPVVPSCQIVALKTLAPGRRVGRPARLRCGKSPTA